MSILDYVDELVYSDGNSTDGTLELIDYIKCKYDTYNKIKVIKDMDFKNFTDDYVRIFNETMKQCKGEYLFFLHPDMIIKNAEVIMRIPDGLITPFAYSVNIKSYAGEKAEWEITKGRTDKWKTIMANKFGLHYYGSYGDANEDMYFKDITGNSHKVHKDMSKYPFDVIDSGININHYCECKPKVRREEKMERVLKYGLGLSDSKLISKVKEEHPRVTLDGSNKEFGDFEFKKREDPLPEVFSKYEEEFKNVLGREHNESIRN